MTNKKSTKRALLSSILSLLLCCTMLIGTTFAWFTDEVKSTNNIITAGNLDVELEYYIGNDQWKTVNGTEDLFSNQLWEPGHTEVVYLRLSNLGTLALKYQLGINIVSETEGTNVYGKTFKLSDYIYMGVVENIQPTFDSRELAISKAQEIGADKGIISNGYTKTGSMAAKTATNPAELYLAVVVYMPTTVENDANYKTGTTAPTINLGINLVATQLMAEEDSFGPDYDEDALVCDILATPETINEILATVEPGTVIGLAAGKYGTITLTQNNLTLVSNTAVVDCLDLNEKDGITVDGLTFDAAGAQKAYNANGADSNYVTNLTDGKAQNGGSVGVVIKNCSFIGEAADVAKYIPVYFGDTKRGNRSDDITIENCEFKTNAWQYITLNGVTNNSNTTPGKIVIKNNVFGGNGFGTSHNTINATGQTCDWTITGNKFNNWNVAKTAIGSSTNGGRVMTWTITGNDFCNEDGAVIIALKTSYTDANTVINFTNNTALGGIATIVTTPVDAENETVYAGHKIQLNAGTELVDDAADLEEALNAGASEIIYPGTEAFEIDENVDISGDVTITFVNPGTSFTIATDAQLNIKNGASLTINNAVIDSADDRDDSAIVVEGAALTLGQGTVVAVDQVMPNGGFFRIYEGNVVLDGAKISGCNNNGNGSLFNVAYGSELVINEGTVIEGNTITGSSSGTRYALFNVDGTLIMNGGVIRNNTYAHKALISVERDGKFVMNGGEITGNTYTGTTSASIVLLFMNSTFEMNGGKIADNNLGTNSNSATFFHTSAGCKVTVNGGTVANNTVNGEEHFAYVRNAVSEIVIKANANVSGVVFGFGINPVDVNTLK